MRNMPKHQTKNELTKSTYTTHFSRTYRPAIWDSYYGLHYQTTPEPRKWHHPYHPDHDCSKAALLFPCKKSITAEEVARLYAMHVFPHYRIPQKIITNWDPHFTRSFTRELLNQLGIAKNMSTAYHLQTNGQSEPTNQWLEQYLRIFGNATQMDWSNWLPLAQYVHNSWINKSTKQIPFKLLIGGLPSEHHWTTTHEQTNEPRENHL